MGVKTHLINNKMENNNIIERVKSLMEFKPVEYGHLISEQSVAGTAKQFKLAGKGATELANLLKMSVDDVRNAVKVATDAKAFEKAVRADLKAGITGVVGPSTKLLSKQKTIQELLNSGKLTDAQVIQIIERNKKASEQFARTVKPKPAGTTAGTAAGTTAGTAAGTAAGLFNKVVSVLGTGWKTMSRSKAIAALLAAGAGVAAIMYFLRNESNPLPDCVINKLTEAELNSVGTSVTFKKTGVKGLDAQGGIILKDDGTCITGNGRYKGTYSCSGDNILVKIGNNEYLIPGGSGTSTTPPKKDDNKKTSTYSRTTADLQQKLYNLGFYIGNTGPAGNGVDGYYGPKTKLAETSWKNGDTCSTFNQRNNYPNPETCKSGTATTGGGTATTGGGTATTGNREIVTTNPNED